ERGEIPPSLHFERPSPHIDFAKGPFFVNTSRSPWPVKQGPRRAGVSAFGVGGTNAHVVIEQAPEATSDPMRGPVLLPLSAKTPAALARATQALARWIEA